MMTLVGGDAQHAQIAGPDMLDRGADIDEDQVHLPGQEIGHGERHAAIRHLGEASPGFALEHVRREMRHAAVTAAA